MRAIKSPPPQGTTERHTHDWTRPPSWGRHFAFAHGSLRSTLSYKWDNSVAVIFSVKLSSPRFLPIKFSSEIISTVKLPSIESRREFYRKILMVHISTGKIFATEIILLLYQSCVLATLWLDGTAQRLKERVWLVIETARAPDAIWRRMLFTSFK